MSGTTVGAELSHLDNTTTFLKRVAGCCWAVCWLSIVAAVTPLGREELEEAVQRV